MKRAQMANGGGGHVLDRAWRYGRAAALWCAIVSQLGVKITEALMVLAGHDHVFLPRLPGQLRPLARSIGLGVEMFGQHFVLRDGNALHFHRPLVTANQAVKPPMNEHSKLGFLPPLNPAVMI